MLSVCEANVSEGNKRRKQEFMNIKIHWNLAVDPREDISKKWNGK